MVPFNKIPPPEKIEICPNGMYIHLTTEAMEFCERFARLQSEFSTKKLDDIVIGRYVEYGYCVALNHVTSIWPELGLKLEHNSFRSSYGEKGGLHDKDDIEMNFGGSRYTRLECKGTRCKFIQNIHTRKEMKFFFSGMSVYMTFVFGFVPIEDRRVIYLAGVSTPKLLHGTSFFMCCGDVLSEVKGIKLESSTYAVRQGALLPFNKNTLEDLKYCRRF